MGRSLAVWAPFLAFFSAGLAKACALDSGDDGRSARPQQQAEAPRQAAMDIDRLLEFWEQQSARLKTLEIDIYRIDKNAAWAEEEHFQGHAAFQSPQQVFLDFQKVNLRVQGDAKQKNRVVVVPVKRNDRIESTPFERMVCTGKEIGQYRFDVKQLFIFPLDNAQKAPLLEAGPLRFLFGMKAAEASRRYEMVLLGQDKAQYLVKVTPRLQEDLENFSNAWLRLDKALLVPELIYVQSADGKSTQEFRLDDIRINEPIDPRRFTIIEPGKPWKMERNPGGPAPAMSAERPFRRRAKDEAGRRGPAADANQPRR